MSKQVLADYLSLTKPRILLLLVVTGYASMRLAAGGQPPLWLSALTMLGLALAGGAANALNCYVDRDRDRRMERTRKRPLPSGRLQPIQALRFGVGLSLASVAILALYVNVLSAALALAGILVYVFVYTVWLKPRSVHNTVVGGVAGAMPPLIGWAAVTGRLDAAALALFALMVLWQPPHFWALAILKERDYRAAGFAMLPVVRGTRFTTLMIVAYAAAAWLTSLALYALHVAGAVYLGTALVLGLLFLWMAWRVWRAPVPRHLWQLFGFSILYLFLLFAVLSLDTARG